MSIFTKLSDDGFLSTCKNIYYIEYFLLHLIKKYYILTSITKVIKSNDEESSNLQKLKRIRNRCKPDSGVDYEEHLRAVYRKLRQVG